MFKNLKYTSFFTYSNGVILDNNLVLPSNHYIYDIIKKYPIPSHLTNVKIVKNKSIEEADNNLVFLGVDKNGKTQYFYGDDYVDVRKTSKQTIFIKSTKVVTDIIKKIEESLKEKEINESFIISTMILLELKTFIRLGKQISFDTYQSIGIRTLKKQHFEVSETGIDIRFVGKCQVAHFFHISVENNTLLIQCLKSLLSYNTNSEFMFALESDKKPISEYKINKFLKNYNLTFKNLRTYGCNIIFLKHFYEIYKTRLDIDSLKKIINKAIKRAAIDIGHSESISKGSYLIENLQKVLEITIKEFKEDTSYQEFLNIFMSLL